MLHTASLTLYTAHCTLNFTILTLYTVHFKLLALHYTSHTTHYTLNTAQNPGMLQIYEKIPHMLVPSHNSMCTVLYCIVMLSTLYCKVHTGQTKLWHLTFLNSILCSVERLCGADCIALTRLWNLTLYCTKNTYKHGT